MENSVNTEKANILDAHLQKGGWNAEEIVFNYGDNPENPAIFKICNFTHTILDREATKGKVVFIHKDSVKYFEEGNTYCASGWVSWIEGRKFETFTPTIIFQKVEDDWVEIYNKNK